LQRRLRHDFSPQVISHLKPRFVELRRRFGVVGDHIFSDCKSSIFFRNNF
ncbi:unnamed protein product, partial [Brassica oleracea]